VTKVVSLAISGHVLALREDGKVWAWGTNTHGELGQGATSLSGPPQLVPGLHAVTAVAASWGTSLALRHNGTLWGWGSNSYGTLGTGTDRQSAPAAVVGLTQVRELASGWGHRLAVRGDGTVWAWGSITSLPPGQSHVAAAVPVAGLSSVVSVAGGSGHSLAVREDGTLWTWGSNYQGELGDGTHEDRATPVQVQGLTGVVAAAAGNSYSLALQADGTVWGWGQNWCGQIGSEPGEARATPVQVQGLSGVVAIYAGVDLSVALHGDGSLWFWGCAEDYWDMEPQVRQVAGLTDITTVTVNQYGFAAVRSDGTVWQSFIRELLEGIPPQQVAGYTNAVAVAYSRNTLQVVRSDGTVWNQGDNHVGERGFPSVELTPPGPSQVPGLTGVVSVTGSAFLETVHALRGNGTAVGWGNNGFGMLGSGVSPLHLEPTQVPLPCRLKVQGAAAGELKQCPAEH
jgi:alpha-tubulin suppressor-like RCC1 family protein